MIATKQNERWFSPPLLILPALYVIVVFLTAIFSERTEGGAFYRIIPLNPIAGAFMMRYDNPTIIVGIFLVTGTPWWYLVGRIRQASIKRRVSRVTLGLGSILALATSWVATSMTLDLLKQDIRQGFMLSPVIVQYSLVGLLCFEAFVSAVSAARATLRP